ncbi:uncharacterized protein EAE97_000360 [Botrytis byssoidea]|uniref:RING-type domain-containing protein n=1 Tax=Botrytis byssoidea TaxID=139641 RepID=A0A9P5IYZ0_9HELO|nr:uncharacterized protein EAE97_000360 [Botrytis byssoidea]KAF7955101.1 hypothetical protein EAE97_000360 [Botrytis byssoidea]
MASNPEEPPDDVPENSRPLAASTSTRARAMPSMHELSGTERSFRTRDPTTRIADEHPLSLILPIVRNGPYRNRTMNTTTVDGSGLTRPSYADLGARNVDRTRRLSNRAEPYVLNFQSDRRHASRTRLLDNLNETASDAHPTVGAMYASRARRMMDSNGRDPDRDYTPTLYDPLPATARNYPNTSNPSSVYVPKRYRPFPLVTARDAPDTGQVYTPRREIYRPHVRATSSINIADTITFSARISEQAQIPREFSASQVPEANSEQARATPEVNSPQLPEASTAVGTSECPICLSPFPAPPNAVLVHPCNHGFCLVCIQTWIQTQRQRPDVRPVNCPFCRGPINRIIDREGNIVEYQRNNVPGVIQEGRERLRRMLGGAVANIADSRPRASRTIDRVNAFDELRRTLNRVGPAGNISEQVTIVRERLDDADADSSPPANAPEWTNGAYGWWV